MRDSILSEGDIGTIKHARVLKPGDTQSMIFTQDDEPPIFFPNTPKLDAVVPGTNVTRNLTAV